MDTLAVVDKGLLEHCAVMGGLGAGPLFRLRRGEAAFSLLALVEGRFSFESVRSTEAILGALLLLLLVTSSEIWPSMGCPRLYSALWKGELLELLFIFLTWLDEANLGDENKAAGLLIGS